MALLTQEDLDRAGLDLAPDAFARFVVEAVRALPDVRQSGGPEQGLTAAEVATLREGGFDLSAATDADSDRDPLVEGAAEYAALLATALSPAEAAARLGVDPSRIRHRLAARTLYGIKTSAGWRLPRFQFDPVTGMPLPNVGAVLSRLDHGLHPLGVNRWFLSPDPDLLLEGRTVSPRDWLRLGGDPEAVVPLTLVV